MFQRPSTALWKPLMQLSTPQGERPTLNLQAQIREMLVSAILNGQMPGGTPVPASREMAEHLGVARYTVVLAYQQLSDEGYLESRQRQPDRSQRFVQRPALQRSIVKPADWQQSPYPFLYGQLDAALLPTAEWRECCMRTLGVLDIREWAPDQISRDDESLLQQIRTRVLPRRGVWAAATG